MGYICNRLFSSQVFTGKFVYLALLYSQVEWR